MRIMLSNGRKAQRYNIPTLSLLLIRESGLQDYAWERLGISSCMLQYKWTFLMQDGMLERLLLFLKVRCATKGGGAGYGARSATLYVRNLFSSSYLAHLIPARPNTSPGTALSLVSTALCSPSVQHHTHYTRTAATPNFRVPISARVKQLRARLYTSNNCTK